MSPLNAWFSAPAVDVTAQLAITSQLEIFGCSQFGRPILKSEIPISCVPVECIKQLFNVQELFYILFENSKSGKQPKLPVQDSQKNNNYVAYTKLYKIDIEGINNKYNLHKNGTPIF